MTRGGDASQLRERETPEAAAAAILPALKYLAAEAERAGLPALAGSIDEAIAVAAVSAKYDHETPAPSRDGHLLGSD